MIGIRFASRHADDHRARAPLEKLIHPGLGDRCACNVQSDISVGACQHPVVQQAGIGDGCRSQIGVIGLQHGQRRQAGVGDSTSSQADSKQLFLICQSRDPGIGNLRMVEIERAQFQ